MNRVWLKVAGIFTNPIAQMKEDTLDLVYVSVIPYTETRNTIRVALFINLFYHIIFL